jgi:hypothetical protein
LKKRTLLTAVLAALAVVGSLVAPAQAAVDDTRINPAKLERGPAGKVPHIDGRSLVHGDVRINFSARGLLYLGRAGDDYVVATWGGKRTPRVLRVTPEGRRTAVLSGVPVWELTLSGDGEHLVRTRELYRQRQTRLQVWDVNDGSVVATRTLRGFIDVLDADGNRMVLTGYFPSRTLWWNHANDTTRRISGRNSYEADISADRLASLTGDPYQGGCSVVSTLSRPRTQLWRSCSQAVLSFSLSGRRVTTVHLLTDGLGPGQVQLRRIGGRLLASYSTYYFGDVLWESDNTLLMLAHGKRRTAWVRCTADDCERTSKLSRTTS